MPSVDGILPLKAGLDSLVAQPDASCRLAQDPLAFARRYPERDDAEVAAVFASALAFGKVAAFLPVLEQVLGQADAHGGPRRWVSTMGPEQASALDPVYHRWVRGQDLALLAATLGEAVSRHGTLEALFRDHFSPSDPNMGPMLDGAVGTLRHLATPGASRIGRPPLPWPELSRGFRSLLSRPQDGSACKRWCMFLRWMIRAPTGPGDVDLGLWNLPASHLVVPLDTHVHRIARYLGLTARTDGTWRTAVQITQGLARLQPLDPVGYDFAIAHLGISGRCPPTGRTAAGCAPCPLVQVCGGRATESAPGR